MEIVLALVALVAICLAPTGLYLAYTARRSEPFLTRK